MTVDEYVAVYGEQYRQLINDSLCWLDEKEKHWGVSLDRKVFLHDLVSHIVKDHKSCALPAEMEILGILPDEKESKG